MTETAETTPEGAPVNEAQAAAQAQASSWPPDEALVRTIGRKILMDWLRNRQQLLVPLALDLQKLDPALATTLLRAMVSAASADGALDRGDERRLEAALTRLNASDEQRAQLPDLIAHRKSLHDVLSVVEDAETGAMVYAASLLASDRRKRVNRYFLRYLGERLKLSHDLARSLEQRFNPAL